MIDLIPRLLAAIDETEAVARGHQQASGSWRNFDADDELRDDVNAGTVAHVYHQADRAHIARHDPDAVIAMCQAHRKLVDEYKAAVEYYDAHPRVDAGELTGLRTAVVIVAGGYGLTTKEDG